MGPLRPGGAWRALFFNPLAIMLVIFPVIVIDVGIRGTTYAIS